MCNLKDPTFSDKTHDSYVQSKKSNIFQYGIKPAKVHQVKSADFTLYKCEKCKSDFKSKPDFEQHKLPGTRI